MKGQITMAKKSKVCLRSDRAKEFEKEFERLAYQHGAWKVWQDFIDLCAISISNVLDKREGIWKEREKFFLSVKDSYTDEDYEVFARLFALVAKALNENPEQDFLGDLYMNLNFGDGWKGQFFTPYHVSEMMARMMIGERTQNEINEKGYVSVNDPACGAGCMLIAFAQAYKAVTNTSYHDSVLFVGQDIDPVVAKMCYIQLSMLGCSGYVVIGNSLTQPIVGEGVAANCSERNIWFTPMYFSDVWIMRRLDNNTSSQNGGYQK